MIIAEDGGEVVVFNKQGEKLKAITHTSVKNPRGVATDPDGHIYVSSSSPPIVAKFCGDGQSLLVQAKINIKSEVLRMMRVIEGQLFICSDYAVIVLDCTNLQEIRRFGRRGLGNGEFNYAVDVVAEKGELYVSDYGNHRIQVFSMEGHYIRKFTLEDPATQESYDPRGLCVGSDGLLYMQHVMPQIVSLPPRWRVSVWRQLLLRVGLLALQQTQTAFCMSVCGKAMAMILKCFDTFTSFFCVLRSFLTPPYRPFHFRLIEVFG